MYDLKAAVCVVAMGLAGCAARAPQTYRLMPKLLVPPGVAASGQAKRTVTVELLPGGGTCSGAGGTMNVVRRGNGVRVTVTPADLADKTPGWLRTWTTAREQEGCIAVGEGLKLGPRIVESMPLDPAVGFRLMHVNTMAQYVDLGAENRLQVDSPIMREGTPADAPVVESANVSGTPGTNNLTVAVRTSSNLVGFETAWYAVQPKEHGPGFMIVPLYAESHIQGVVERHPGPHTNYFHFRPDAAFFRTFYRGDRTIILVSAPTRVELDRETEALKNDGSACATFPAETCVQLPQNVGMNPHIVVQVNGKEVPLPVGANVRRAITAAGERNADSVAPRLTVRKMYGGRLAAVEFDRASPEILNLTLVGGEEIDWK